MNSFDGLNSYPILPYVYNPTYTYPPYSTILHIHILHTSLFSLQLTHLLMNSDTAGCDVAVDVLATCPSDTVIVTDFSADTVLADFFLGDNASALMMLPDSLLLDCQKQYMTINGTHYL